MEPEKPRSDSANNTRFYTSISEVERLVASCRTNVFQPESWRQIGEALTSLRQIPNLSRAEHGQFNDLLAKARVLLQPAVQTYPELANHLHVLSSLIPLPEAPSPLVRPSTAQLVQRVLIYGVWGALGRSLVENMFEEGVELRCIIQQERASYFQAMAKAGVDCVEVDWNDQMSINGCFIGVDKFIMFTDLGLVENLMAKTIKLCEAAATFKCKHVVTVSYLGEEKWHRSSEKYALSSGLPVTVCHMNLLFQSFLALRNHDTFKLPMGDARVGWVDAADVAETVTKICLSDTDLNQGKIYVLCGPELLTCEDIARTISEVAKRRVSYVGISMDDARRNLHGDPDWLVDSKIDIWNKNVQGWTAVLSPDIEFALNRPPTSFATFARLNAHFWE